MDTVSTAITQCANAAKQRTAVFLIHPRDHRDLAATFWWTRFLPPCVTDPVLSRLSGKFGYTVCEHQIIHHINFYVLGIALKGYQMVPAGAHDLKRIRMRILDAVRYAEEELHADVIGLGALTASMTDGGKWLMKQNLKSRITHGNTYATLIAEQGIEQIVKMQKLMHPVIAIVGAYGIIGSALCRLLSQRHRLILMGRNRNSLERLAESLEGNHELTTDLSGIKSADIVVTATSNPESLLQDRCLKNGVVVYDVSQPPNATRALLNQRPDITRIDGSLICTPGTTIRFDPATGADETYACLGETILTALEGIDRNVVGNIDLAYLEKMREIGMKYGYVHAEFTSFGERLDVAARRETV